MRHGYWCTYIGTALECSFFVRTSEEMPVPGRLRGRTYIGTALECSFFVRTSEEMPVPGRLRGRTYIGTVLAQVPF